MNGALTRPISASSRIRAVGCRHAPSTTRVSPSAASTTAARASEATASYAKQAKDTALHDLADRIQARAIRRCGELLRQIAPERGGDRRSDQRADTGPLNRTQAARQRKTALRVAAIPEGEFEVAVESDRSPTVTALAITLLRGYNRHTRRRVQRSRAAASPKRDEADRDPVCIRIEREWDERMDEHGERSYLPRR